MIIAFSGIDGAGKSTQINLLIDYLKENKKRTKYIWARGGYTPGFNFLKKIIRKSGTTTVPKPGRSQERAQAFEAPLMRKIWLILAILDITFLYAVYIRWMEIRGYSIICDRWIDDTLLDFQLNFPQEQVHKWWLWKLYLFCAPKPDRSFLFLIPVEESIRRSKLKNEPFPDSKEVLIERLSQYEAFDSGHWIKIDGTRSVQDVHWTIREAIKL